METVELRNKIKSLLECINIYYEDCLVNDEPLLQKLSEFSSEIIFNDNEARDTGVVFHTGSELYDVILISIMYLSLIADIDHSVDRKINNLEVGDIVIYARTRQKFCGIERTRAGDSVVLESKTQGVTRVPPNLWYKVLRYYGDSRSLDSRGLFLSVDNEAINKLASCLVDKSDGYLFKSITSAFVLCMNRERAENYYNKIAFSFNDDINSRVSLNEIATMTYYTENEEYQIGSNPLKSEACIQVTSDLSIARKLVRHRTHNDKVGVLVSGDEIISQSDDDLKDVMNFRKLQYAFISNDITSKNISSIIQDYQDALFFSCTRDFMLTYSGYNRITKKRIKQQFHDEIDTGIECELAPEIIDSRYRFEDCAVIKKSIHFIANDSYESEEKDLFVIYSNATFNLLIRSAFTLSEMSAAIDSGCIDVKSVSARIEELKGWSSRFPTNIKDKADFVISSLEEMANYSTNKCYKEDYLIDFITSTTNKNIAIVVDKKYYSTIMLSLNKYTNRRYLNRLYITTPNRFDSSILYDYVFVVGWIDGKNFDALSCINSKNVVPLLYNYESKLLASKLKKRKSLETILNEISKYEVEMDEDFEELALTEEEETVVEEYITEESETIDLVEKLRRKYITKGFMFNTSGSVCSLAVKSIKLDSRHVVFLSKNYKAYVYDASSNTIRESSIDKLCEGDTLVFTSSSSTTTDIVEIIMNQRWINNEYSDDDSLCIEKSKYWKNLIKEYQEKTHITDENVSKQLKQIGIPVIEQTIMGWLDDDSRTICPQNIESLVAIGKLCKDKELQKNAEFYYNCCKEVKHIRRGILNEIAIAIRGRVTGNNSNTKKDVYDLICESDGLVSIASIEYISDIEPREVPVNKINRPLMQGE